MAVLWGRARTGAISSAIVCVERDGPAVLCTYAPRTDTHTVDAQSYTDVARWRRATQVRL